MADVKWIKLTTDIFDDEKILLIESLPSADSIIVIWFKLLVLAGKQNNNGVFMICNRMPYTDEMLSSIFRRDIQTVRMALQVFEQFGMVEIVEGVYTIPNWNKHQSLDAYDKKKERDRKYAAERRAAQKALISQESSDKSSDKSSDVAVTEEDKEIDKEIDKDKDILSLNSPMFKGEEKAENVQNSVQNIKTYGTHNNVKMPDKQYKQLKTAYPDADYTIDRLSDYIADTQKYSTYHDHTVVLMKWAEEDAHK